MSGLDRYSCQVVIWLAGTAVPWAVGIQLGLQLTVGADRRTEHIVVGFLTGILLGAVTGLIWLWRLSSQSSSMERRVLGTGALQRDCTGNVVGNHVGPAIGKPSPIAVSGAAT